MKLLPALFIVLTQPLWAQREDSIDNERLSQMVSLSEVVLHSGLNVARFMDRVKNDTTFYKAFRTLHILGFTSLNDIRMSDKKGRLKASMQSKTVQQDSGNCRSMKVIEERTSGDF